jgi:diadenylate cyclase
LRELIDQIGGIIERATWNDVAELVMIGVAVYAIMRFLRGTRGARLLRGFVMLLIGGTLLLSWIANLFNMERIQTLYPIFTSDIFLVALVAFQPELRRALIRLGAAKWFADSPQAMDRVIEQVIDSVAYLSKNKIGALIAFEKSTEFGALMDSGIRLDANVTKQLLMTIFWPGSALHDMGVIISQGRIAAAAVQFPLADSDEVSIALGSRHRAAIGLSQESDALVLVVSEETGIISVIQSGNMQRNLTPESLRQILRAELVRKTEDAGK